MARFFLVGNVWVAVAILRKLGQTFERSAPTRDSFFGMGRWFSASEYNILVAIAVVMAIVCFALFVSTSWKSRHPEEIGASSKDRALVSQVDL